MKSFAAIRVEGSGEALYQASLAEEEREDVPKSARSAVFAGHRARQAARRTANIAKGWDRAMAQAPAAPSRPAAPARPERREELGSDLG